MSPHVVCPTPRPNSPCAPRTTSHRQHHQDVHRDAAADLG
jgi:hypothetical protein